MTEDERIISQRRELELQRRELERMRAEHDSVFGPHECPGWARESLDRYIKDGVETGDCLRAVLANDLMGAFARADVNSARRMAAIVSYIYNNLPSTAHGSYEVVDFWISEHPARRTRGGAP